METIIMLPAKDDAFVLTKKDLTILRQWEFDGRDLHNEKSFATRFPRRSLKSCRFPSSTGERVLTPSDCTGVSQVNGSMGWRKGDTPSLRSGFALLTLHVTLQLGNPIQQWPLLLFFTKNQSSSQLAFWDGTSWCCNSAEKWPWVSSYSAT